MAKKKEIEEHNKSAAKVIGNILKFNLIALVLCVALLLYLKS